MKNSECYPPLDHVSYSRIRSYCQEGSIKKSKGLENGLVGKDFDHKPENNQSS